jgi:hypothetical protein
MKVVEVARKYLGKTEKPGNMGFTDADFEQRMVDVGFQKGHAWCAYFTELCFKEAYPEKFDEFDRLFSASTIQTFRNFQKAGYHTSMVPEAGDLVIWQNYKDGKPLATGHAGIVTWESDSNLSGFKSIEGNTSAGKSREGFIVAEHPRNVDPNVKKGLKVLGFVKIP